MSLDCEGVSEMDSIVPLTPSELKSEAEAEEMPRSQRRSAHGRLD